MSNNSIYISPKLINTILDNNFGMPTVDYLSSDIYVGLGIEFDEESFTFTKEPVKEGFTILPNPVAFETPTYGYIRNIEALEWPKAKQPWSTTTDPIRYIGLYYKLPEESNGESQYQLMVVLPLVPEEVVNVSEKVVLNPYSIQVKLSNR